MDGHGWARRNGNSVPRITPKEGRRAILAAVVFCIHFVGEMRYLAALGWQVPAVAARIVMLLVPGQQYPWAQHQKSNG